MSRPPINFVHHDLGRWDDLRNLDSPPLPHELPNRFTEGWDCWTIQPYLHLKRRGWDVRLGFGLVPGMINIMHADTFLMRGPSRHAFSFVIRADRPPVVGADMLAVQNPVLADPRRRVAPVHYLPLFPEPGLVPRDSSRGPKLERMAYMGRIAHLAEPFRSPAFRSDLRKMGIELEIRESDWWDYTEIDAVLAIRQAPRELLRTKPATKLYNAWIAGCIPFLGDEPAYAALRRSELDYIHVSSTRDVLAGVCRLQEDPPYAAAMRENAANRAREFTTERIVETWENLLSGPVEDAYRRWQERSPAGRLLHRLRLASATRRRRSVWDAWDLRNGLISLEQVRGRWSWSYLRRRLFAGAARSSRGGVGPARAAEGAP